MRGIIAQCASAGKSRGRDRPRQKWNDQPQRVRIQTSSYITYLMRTRIASIAVAIKIDVI